MMYRFVMLICLLLSLPIWTACSNAEATPTATQTIDTDITIAPTISQDIDATSFVPELSETYTGENSLVNAVLTVNYPSGWTAQGSGTQVLLASTDPETFDSDRDALLINIMPIAPEMLQDLTEASPEALVAQAMFDTTGQEVEVLTTTINEQPAAYAALDLDENSSLVYALQIEEGVMMVLTAIKAQAFTLDDEALIFAIVETIQYDAGEIPQSE